MAFSFQPKVVSNGMVLCVDAANTKSYPGSGTIWTDLSSTGITGSLTNGPTFNSANGGNIVFDGSNDYVNFGNVLGFDGSTPFSLTAWFKTTNTVDNNPWTLSGKDLITPPFTGYQMGFNVVSGSAGDRGKFGFVLVDNSLTVLRRQTTSSYNDGNWYYGAVTYDGSKTRGGILIYINGTSPSVTDHDSSTFSGTISNNVNFEIGARDGVNQPFPGNIAHSSIYNRALSATEVLQNYNALCGRFGKTPSVTDYDALNFVNAALISNETQQIAINTLTTDLKNAGLWAKMKAIYPFVGGTASTHRWNLKDPRDLDAAFRLTFSGGWTHSTSGSLPNGTNGYADTYVNESASFSNNNQHMSIYSRTESDGLYCDMGVLTDVNTESSIFSKYNNIFYPRIQATNNGISNTITSKGLFIANRVGSTEIRGFQNNVLKQITNSSLAKSNFKIFIGAHSFGNTANLYSNRELAFATIGDGLTDTDAANLYTIVQKYQTTLGRQV
jgi:hypothetical protein